MNEQDLEGRLKKLLMDRCGTRAEAIRPEAQLQADLGLDSLDAVELAIAIEDEFDVKMRDEDIKRLGTVAEALTLLKQLLAEKAPAGGSAPVLRPAGS